MLPLTLLQSVFVLTPNEGEAKSISGCADLELAGLHLCEQGVENVVITLGPRGALLVTEQGAQQRRPISEAVSRAAVVASIAVTRDGAQSAMPSVEEIS